MIRLGLAEICRTHGWTLADLARVSDVSLARIKQLEQDPPRKSNTWLRWQERISHWIPLLGHAFPDALESRAFATCPREIIADLLAEYDRWASTIDKQELKEHPGTTDRELELISRAAELDAKGDWDRAEIWIERAARLFPQHDSRWAYHHFTIAQLRVNKGELESAEKHISETISRHQAALHGAGMEWESQSLALAEATRAWSRFLKGEWESAKKGFDQALHLAHLGHDIDLVHRGWHMGARALAEPYVIRAYFSPKSADRRLDRVLVTESIDRFGAALALDDPGSAREAYGLWYEGVLLSLDGDVNSGFRLLEHAAKQLGENKMATAALSHAGLSRVHLNILSTAWDLAILRRSETQIRDMLPLLMTEKFPYAIADALITLAYCRLQRSELLSLLNERQETADLLCLALIAHPYPQHILWQFGRDFLIDRVMPAFTDYERASYVRTLHDRVYHGDHPFDYLLHWQFDLSPLSPLLKSLGTTVTTRRA